MKRTVTGALCVLAPLLYGGSMAAAEPLSMGTSEWPPYDEPANGKAAGLPHLFRFPKPRIAPKSRGNLMGSRIRRQKALRRCS